MEKQVKAIPFEIKEIDEEERSFLAVASTEDIDRDNDRIMAAGWDLGNFLKNPVVPWAHRYGEPPVARASEVFIQDGKLMFRPKFPTKGEYEFADTVWKLYRGGFLRSFSVGFMPKRYEIVEREKGRRGYDYLEQELWEISACTVPSNPNALVAAKTKGVISQAELEEIDDWRKWHDKNEWEEEKKEIIPELGESLEDFLKTPPEDVKKYLIMRFDDLENKISALFDEFIRPMVEYVEELTRVFEDANKNLDAIIASKRQPEPEPPAINNQQSAISNPEPPAIVNQQSSIINPSQVTEIAEGAAKGLKQKLGEVIDKRIKYHMGIVD